MKLNKHQRGSEGLKRLLSGRIMSSERSYQTDKKCVRVCDLMLGYSDITVVAGLYEILHPVSRWLRLPVTVPAVCVSKVSGTGTGVCTCRPGHCFREYARALK